MLGANVGVILLDINSDREKEEDRKSLAYLVIYCSGAAIGL